MLLRRILYFLPSLILASDLPERGPVILTSANIDDVLANSELVFVSFVAEWCHFSRLLTPVWEEAAKEMSKDFPVEKLTFGVVQTDKGGADLGQKYNINKYPTMKLFRSGTVSKKEYRGARSVDAFENYINEQLTSKIKVFEKNNDFLLGNAAKNLPKMSRGQRNVVGYFENKESASFKAFETLAGNLKDDCIFWAGIGEGIAEERMMGDNIIFKPEGENSSDQVFMGDITNTPLLNSWILEKCVPLVREITFTNGEELTEEGKPFLILFHKKEDTQSLETYKKVAENELTDQRDKLTILHADCEQFAHPLWHLGKSVNSCPIIAIDSFKHMYTFKNYNDIHTEGKLKEFCEDLHSGKLHREFHNGPDPVVPAKIEDKSGANNNNQPTEPEQAKIDPKNLKIETKTKVEVQKAEPGQDPNKAEIKVTEEKVLVDKNSGEVISSTSIPIGDDASRSASIKLEKKKGPVESQFAKLKPSELKYSIPKKDEL